MKKGKRNIPKRSLLILVAAAVCAVGFGYHWKQNPALISVHSTVNGRELPIYNVQTDEPKISISFDAAWGNDDTSKILEVLKKHQVHATFFMTGGWVESYPDDVKAILADGHDLGNHSENHKNMSQLSVEEIQSELMTVHNKVKELTGYDMFLFRPPYGDYDNEVIQTVKGCNYYPIQWSIDSLDWKNYGVEDLINRVCNSDKLQGGAIILCHNGAKYTAEALDQLLNGLEEKGFQLVPISELIIREDYHVDVNGMQVPDGNGSDSNNGKNTDQKKTGTDTQNKTSDPTEKKQDTNGNQNTDQQNSDDTDSQKKQQKENNNSIEQQNDKKVETELEMKPTSLQYRA